MKKYIATSIVCREHHTSTNEILYWARRFQFDLFKQGGIIYISSDDVEVLVDALNAVREV
jgi:hypothetical protein